MTSILQPRGPSQVRSPDAGCEEGVLAATRERVGRGKEKCALVPSYLCFRSEHPHDVRRYRDVERCEPCCGHEEEVSVLEDDRRARGSDS